jgi:hypothetical protein
MGIPNPSSVANQVLPGTNLLPPPTYGLRGRLNQEIEAVSQAYIEGVMRHAEEEAGRIISEARTEAENIIRAARAWKESLEKE